MCGSTQKGKFQRNIFYGRDIIHGILLYNLLINLILDTPLSRSVRLYTAKIFRCCTAMNAITPLPRDGIFFFRAAQARSNSTAALGRRPKRKS